MQDMICDCICTYRKDGQCELGIPNISGDRQRRGFCPALSRSYSHSNPSKDGIIN